MKNENSLLLALIAILAATATTLGSVYKAAGEKLNALGGTPPGDDEAPAPKAVKEKPAKQVKEKQVDFSELGIDADQGDEDAIAKLTEYAEKHELDPNDYPTWAELAEAIVDAETPVETLETETPKAGKAKKDGVTLADLREKAKGIIRAGHGEEVKELLENYDAEVLTTLDEEQYEKFDKSLDKLAKKLGV